MGLTEQLNAVTGDGFSVLLGQLKDHAVFLLDPYGNVISSGKNAELITGYPPGDIQGKSFSFFFNKDALRRKEDLHAIEYAKEYGIYTKQHSLITNEGVDIPCILCLTALPDEKNSIKNFTLTLSFISKGINKINEAFHLARLITRTMDAIFSTDLSFNILSWNEAAEKMYGYKRDEVLGRPLREVVRPQMTTEVFKEIDEGVTQNGYWMGEVVHLAKDNRRIDIDESISITKDMQGMHDGYVWVCRDITVIKHKEEQLLHMAKLIENTNDAIYTASPDNVILSWNNAAEKMYGYTKEEAINHSAEDILQPQIPAERRAEIRAHIERMDHWKGEITHKRKDGSLLPILISVNIIKNRNNVVEEFICICSDISELKRNEESLRKMQEEITRLTQEKLDKSLKEIEDYKYALDAACIVDITDADGNIKYVNDNFCKLSKYNADELIGNNHHIVNSGFHSHEFMRGMVETIRNGKIWNGEVKNKAKDGSYFWVEATIVPFLDAEGNPYQYLEIGVDISEKKEVEEVILKEKKLSDSIINSLPGIFYLYGGNGKFLRWNKQFEIVTGYSAEEIKQMTPDMFFISDDKKIVYEKINAAFKEGSAEAEANIIIKSGEKIPYYLTGVLTKYDDMPCVIGTGINISTRKKAEKELYDSEQKYKMLFENNPLPMWMFTIPERNIIEVNNAAISHYGYTRKEFLSLSLVDLRPDEDKELFIEQVKNTPSGIRNAGVWRHKKKDGSVIYAEIFRDDIIYKGQQVRLVLANDISEKFMTEQRLKESHDLLRSLASHLQDIREEERAVIAREIHDELGQQITGLKMDVSWISKRILSEDDTVHQKIKNILQLLDETVKTVRKIATELRPSILDDLGLVDALQWYSLEFEKRFGIPVSFHTSAEEISLSKNMAVGLFRIYQESLTNVARHALAKFVKTDLAVEDNILKLTISDNGKGFDTAQTKNKKTLGLLGMKERTLMMGGTYIINSAPGKGTTVYVSVPIINA